MMRYRKGPVPAASELNQNEHPAARAPVSTCITRLFIWAHYPCHYDTSVQPPAIDQQELAALVRVLFTCNDRLTANATDYLKVRDENQRLQVELKAYRAKLESLRKQVDALTPAPWENNGKATDKTTGETKDG